MDLNLHHRTAIVTGGATGLGKEFVLSLAKEGVNICFTYMRDEECPEQLVETVKSITNVEIIAVKTDLSDEQSRENLFATCIEKLGNADILVNNAGIIRRHDALTFTESDWDAVIDLNVKAVFFLCQAVARQFIRQGEGGKIINIASMLSFQGGIRVPSYTASKSGVLGLTRLLANEWAGQGINVNAIAPGYMATNNTQALREDEERNQAILERIPAGRWGAPKDLQGPVVFLASSAADYIHGYTLAVDGGWRAR